MHETVDAICERAASQAALGAVGQEHRTQPPHPTELAEEPRTAPAPLLKAPLVGVSELRGARAERGGHAARAEPAERLPPQAGLAPLVYRMRGRSGVATGADRQRRLPLRAHLQHGEVGVDALHEQGGGRGQEARVRHEGLLHSRRQRAEAERRVDARHGPACEPPGVSTDLATQRLLGGCDRGNARGSGDCHERLDPYVCVGTAAARARGQRGRHRELLAG